jgi:hypothetical protein
MIKAAAHEAKQVALNDDFHRRLATMKEEMARKRPTILDTKAHGILRATQQERVDQWSAKEGQRGLPRTRRGWSLTSPQPPTDGELIRFSLDLFKFLSNFL